MSKVLRVVGAIAAVAAAVVTAGVSLGISAGLLTAIGTGASIGASLLARRPQSPQASPADRDRLFSNIDPRTPRKILFGNTALATDIRYEEYTGQNDEFFHRNLVVAAHRIGGIDQIWFGNELAWTSSGGVQGDFRGYLVVDTRLEGNAGNAITISSRRGNTLRYTGMAYVHFRFRLTDISENDRSPFAQSIPSRVTIRGRGMPVYDPRLDSTAGGNGPQRANDQSTWQFNTNNYRNPALQLLTFYLGYRINGHISVGRGVPSARLDLNSFRIAANMCDEQVALAAGGSENRYYADGIFSESDTMEVVGDHYKSTMNATIDDVNGQIRVTVLHNDLAMPIASFTDDDILDVVQWSPQANLQEYFNVVRGTYTDPSDEALYQSVSYPEIAIDSLDGIERVNAVDFPLVQNARQCQRLARQRLQRMQFSGMFSSEFKATGWRVLKGDIISLSFIRLGFVNKLFRVVENDVTFDGVVTMLLREEDSSIYAWDRDERAAVVASPPDIYNFRNNPNLLAIAAAATTAEYDNVSGAPTTLNELDNIAGLKLDGIADNATNNRGFLADLNAVDLAQNTTGVLPVSKAVPELINTNITVDGAGVINGIGTANISVDNRLNDRIINLVAVGTGKVEGNSVSKTGGFGQNGGAYSREASTSFYASCFYDFATLTGSVDFGLSNEATPDGTDRNDFLCRIAINGNGDFMDLFVGTVGFARFTVASGALPSSGVLTIIYEGQNCSFFVNGILLRERLSQDVNAIVRALIMPTSGGVVSKLDNISYGPANNTLWDAIAESENRPADRATSNIQLQRFGPRASDVIVVGNSMSTNANSNSSGVYTSVCRQKTALFQVTYNGFRGGFLGLYDTSDYDFPASNANFGRIGLNISTPNANGQVSCGLFYREEGPTVFAAFFSRIFNVGDKLGFICDGTHYHFTVNGAINYSIRAVNNNELKSYIIINGQPSTGQFPFIDIDWLPYTDNALASLGGLGLAEENIRNPIINADGTLEVVKGDGNRINLPGQVTLGGIGAGAVATLDVIDENHAADELKNAVLVPSIQAAATTAVYSNVFNAPTSLSELDAAAGTKLGGIANNATRNTGALANVDTVNLAGSFVNGILPTTRAADGLKNSVLIPSIASAAQTAQYSSVTGAPQALADLDEDADSKLAGIQELADRTDDAIRTIIPQFPMIEIKQFEEGNQGSRLITHFIRRGGATISGGAWSLGNRLLGAGNASINSSNGLVTLSNINQSGSYEVIYTHTDTIQTRLIVNVTYVAAPVSSGGGGGGGSNPPETVLSISNTPSVVDWFQGSTNAVSVSHTAREDGIATSGGTWSIQSISVGSVTINSNGVATVTNVNASGFYTVRYTLAGGARMIDKSINIQFYPNGPGSPQF